MPELLIRDVQSSDHDEWVVLYAGYREFYQLAPDARVVETIWDWVLNGTYTMRGLVAVGGGSDDGSSDDGGSDDGTVVAIANLHVIPRPTMARTGLYLDDLFTAPAARGTGAGAALLARAAEQAAEEGHALVRWITASDNATARRLYDEHATATSWVTYDMPPAPH